MEFTPQTLVEFWKPLAGLAAMVVGGLWTVFVYFDRRRLAQNSPETENRAAEAMHASGAPTAATTGGLTLPLMVVLGGAALLVWAATGDTCELGDVDSDRSILGCEIRGHDITLDARQGATGGSETEAVQMGD